MQCLWRAIWHYLSKFKMCMSFDLSFLFPELDFVCLFILQRASQLALVVKNPPANAGDTRDTGLIPGSERSAGGGHGNPLQYCSLENPMDRGAGWATVHGVAESDTTEVT